MMRKLAMIFNIKVPWGKLNYYRNELCLIMSARLNALVRASLMTQWNVTSSSSSSLSSFIPCEAYLPQKSGSSIFPCTMSIVHVPNILLAIPRNPVTALGLPLALGFLSGSPASKEANSKWYHVCPLSLWWFSFMYYFSSEPPFPSLKAFSWGIPIRVEFAIFRFVASTQ